MMENAILQIKCKNIIKYIHLQERSQEFQELKVFI